MKKRTDKPFPLHTCEVEPGWSATPKTQAACPACRALRAAVLREVADEIEERVCAFYDVCCAKSLRHEARRLRARATRLEREGRRG